MFVDMARALQWIDRGFEECTYRSNLDGTFSLD